MKIEIEVPERFIADQICTACESGIYYWVDQSEGVEFKGEGNVPDDADEITKQFPHYWAPIQDGAMCFTEAETGKKFEIKKADFGTALELMATKYTRHFSHMMSEQGDAITADVLIQLAAFGEIKYG